jgi:hypothetical protein
MNYIGGQECYHRREHYKSGGYEMNNRIQAVKDFYKAFASGDREYVERILAKDFIFSSPPDPYLDRAGFFERCWPGAGNGTDFNFVRLVESGDEIIVTYESEQNGKRGRNTEVLTFEGDQISRTEVYFGWEGVDGSA